MKGTRFLVAALAGVIAVAMAVSYHALDAVAVAIGAGATAPLYPVAVDGVIGLAVVASLVLRGGPGARWAVGTLLVYTTASGVLNVAHADGLMTRSSPVLVVLAAVLPVGTVAIGTHLVVLVLRHRAAAARPDAEAEALRTTPSVVAADPVPAPEWTAVPAGGDTPVPLPVPVEADTPVRTVADDPSGVPSGTAAESDAEQGGTMPSRPRLERVRTTRTTAPARPPRTSRPARGRDDLLDTVRAMADESGATPSAAAIARAVRCRAETARSLRDAVEAERTTAAALVVEAEALTDTTPAEVTR